MKKITFIVVLLTIASFTVHAQLFLGGGISFNTEGGSRKSNGISTDKPTKSLFVFGPKAGYYLTEDFAFGAQLVFSSSKTKTTTAGIETTDKGSSFGIAPFARYHVVRFDKFSFFMQGELGLAFGSSKTEAAGMSADGPKTTDFHFAITPALAYDISDRIGLETSLDFLGLGYYSSRSKTGSGNTEVTDQTSKFGFSANMDNIATLGTITVGAIFKF